MTTTTGYRIEARYKKSTLDMWVARERVTTEEQARVAVEWYRGDEPQNDIRCVRISEEIVEFGDHPIERWPWEAYSVHGDSTVPCSSETSAQATAANLSSVIFPWRALTVWEQDRAVIRAMADVEIASGYPTFMDWPDRWFANWTVRCENGHVSKRILKTDEGDRCLACQGRTHMTFPEDVETEPPSHLALESV